MKFHPRFFSSPSDVSVISRLSNCTSFSLTPTSTPSPADPPSTLEQFWSGSFYINAFQWPPRSHRESPKFQATRESDQPFQEPSLDAWERDPPPPPAHKLSPLFTCTRLVARIALHLLLEPCGASLSHSQLSDAFYKPHKHS